MLELLVKLFGRAYVNRMIGTGTNISKPIKFDKNSPFKLYSDSAFKDSDVLRFIEKKIAEYGPFALANRNASEVKNFEMNARRLLLAKEAKKESTVKKAAEAMFGPIGKKEKPEINPELLKMTDDKLNALAKEGDALQAKRVLTEEERKRLDYIGNLLEDAQKLPNTGKGLTEDLKAAGFEPEAEVFDIATSKKVGDEGIMTLKSELGLPKGVEPGSTADKAIKESAQYKMDQQGVKSLLDEGYTPPKTTTLEDDIADLEKGVDDVVSDLMAKGYSAAQEGKRRAVIRQVLLKDKRIKLPEDVRKSLSNYDDLRGGGDQNMDPLKIFETYYERDNEALGTLDGIIDTAENEFKAADTFLASKDNFKVKKPVVRESLDDEAVEIEESKILDDPEDLAEGGRPGFKFGTGKEGIKGILKMMNEKFGKGAVKTADQVTLTNDMVLAKETKRALEELKDYKDIAPQFYQRMTLKLKYPGISDELIAKIMADDDPQRVAEVLATLDEAFKMMDKGMSPDEILNTFKKTPRTKNAGGGLNYLMGM